MLKHQLPFDHRSQAAVGLVSTWMGDPYPSVEGAVAELSQLFGVGEAFFLPLSECLHVTLNGRIGLNAKNIGRYI